MYTIIAAAVFLTADADNHTIKQCVDSLTGKSRCGSTSLSCGQGGCSGALLVVLGLCQCMRVKLCED